MHAARGLGAREDRGKEGGGGEEWTHVVFLVVDNHVRSGRRHEDGLTPRRHGQREGERERGREGESGGKNSKRQMNYEGRRNEWDVKLWAARSEPGPHHLS